MKKLVFILSFIIFLGGALISRTTSLFFTDMEKAEGNILSVATDWGITPTPTIEPTPTPTPSYLANHVVINEVYYDVAPNKGTEPANEWIELYNGTLQSIDLQNWQLCDNLYCRTIAASSLTLNPSSFAVITNSESTWGYWAIPDGVIKVVLSSSLSLANSTDMLILKDKEGNIIDQMNWGTPDLGWPNYNVNLWNPGPSVLEGHSLERSPAGKDTNTAADFIDQTAPTPGS